MRREGKGKGEEKRRDEEWRGKDGKGEELNRTQKNKTQREKIYKLSSETAVYLKPEVCNG